MDLQPAGHAGRGRPGGAGHRAGSAPRGSAGRLLPAVLRRRNPRVRLRTTAGQALRPSAARGADAAAAARGSKPAICTKKTWREQGINSRKMRKFYLWRQAPMFYVDCQGRLLDKYEPSVKERLLLQIRPRREVRADRGAGQVPGREEARRNALGGSGRARPPAAISTPKTWSRSGGSSWPRDTARRWSCEA